MDVGRFEPAYTAVGGVIGVSTPYLTVVARTLPGGTAFSFSVEG
ncbi:hypothetical protein SAMN05421837_106148 [Amycolatopsis pretoriensis]|uniref:Uncharacterized protein n=1 Tax=Amycolatopsis pretoriensis TaxID=218821 RepID=A0A1H5R3X2_9PSEU|nr:hypothetical protein [Amycolatopsis pretoriensis]SEF32261.1 hypothetical protein SAMN05421837_106148 [Amycolatopsis pretoriensis]